MFERVRWQLGHHERINMPSKIISAAPYDAKQCPICQTWVYVARGPFAENDRSKPIADFEHYEREHATPADYSTSPTSAVVFGIPYFPYNDTRVNAVLYIPEGK
jgi:hypothetical protein